MQTAITCDTPPRNFIIVDRFLSRSAQPYQDNLRWLKQQQVTDIINFETEYETAIGFDERAVTESLGMKYHKIPSVTTLPQEHNVINFLNLINRITQKNGRAHIHCKAGADRTGMYTFLYKGVKNIGSQPDNITEWLNLGHNQELFPDLIPWAERLLKRLKKRYK